MVTSFIEAIFWTYLMPSRSRLLLSLDIVCYYLALVTAVTARKTTAAFITFIPLTVASEAIVDHFQ